MNVLSIIKKHLTEGGYDGLCSDAPCGCLLADGLAPCGDASYMDCEPGYKIEGCSDECGSGCDWHVSTVSAAEAERRKSSARLRGQIATINANVTERMEAKK